MTFVDRYPAELSRHAESAQADEAVMRLVWRRLPLAGLPEQLQIGDVTAYFTIGPVLSQETAIRQRHQWPPVFDKSQRRALPVGESELLTVLELQRPLVRGSEDVTTHLEQWRRLLMAACACLTVSLDERIALELLAEDVVLYVDGQPVAAVDVRRSVRTFMPFDVDESDRVALAGLEHVDLESPAAHAASLLAQGSRLGPTAEGYLLLWFAIDAVVATRKSQKNAVLNALEGLRLDLTWLGVPLGRLVGLRGDLAHGRPVPEQMLRDGFYDAEAIARALVRSVGGGAEAWPLATTPIAFPLPLGRRIAEQRGSWREEWHEAALPVPAVPSPIGLPRVDAFRGGHSDVVRIDGADEEVVEAVRFWVLAAINAADVDVQPLVVEVVEQLESGGDFAVNVERIRIRRGALSPWDEVQPRVAWQLCRLVAEMQVMRVGVDSVSLGALLIELGGTFVAYGEWVVRQGMPSELLSRVDLDSATAQDIGAVLGLALAGDDETARDLDAWFAAAGGGSELKTAAEALYGALWGLEDLGQYLQVCAEFVAAESGRRA